MTNIARCILERLPFIRWGPVTIAYAAALSCGGSASASMPDDPRPNILLVMADDMGWGDPSYSGGWISTPTLDAMASSGLRFDRFYAKFACRRAREGCLPRPLRPAPQALDPVPPGFPFGSPIWRVSAELRDARNRP